jgi:outer membrane receptor protein involved in Fe transport
MKSFNCSMTFVVRPTMGQFGPALILTPYNYEQGKIYGIELTSNYKSGDLSSYANLARTESLAKEAKVLAA